MAKKGFFAKMSYIITNYLLNSALNCQKSKTMPSGNLNSFVKIFTPEYCTKYELAGKAIFSTFPVAPPIIVSEIFEISKMIIGGATGKVLKMALPANMTS